MEKVSKHISYREATRSNTANRLGIHNMPTDFQFKNMQLVANKCFEPLREHHGKPIYISSFLRCIELNTAIKGSETSQHVQGGVSKLEEGAIDIDCDVYDNGLTNAEAFYWLKDNVKFDQLIWEYGDRDNPDWVHVSYRKGANRGMVLRKERGKNYELFE